jgi:hypothetical protein
LTPLDFLIPPFISLNGPVCEARLINYPDGSPDGNVQALFTITGRTDAPGCRVIQPDFTTELAKNNIALRISTPLFGAGLIEQIPDGAILANQRTDTLQKKTLGIRGQPNFVRFGGAVENRYPVPSIQARTTTPSRASAGKLRTNH